MGNYYAAKISFEKCIELSPEYLRCYYASAAYYDYTGNKQLAFAAVKKAYELVPKEESIKGVYNHFQMYYLQFE